MVQRKSKNAEKSDVAWPSSWFFIFEISCLSILQNSQLAEIYFGFFLREKIEKTFHWSLDSDGTKMLKNLYFNFCFEFVHQRCTLQLFNLKKEASWKLTCPQLFATTLPGKNQLCLFFWKNLTFKNTIFLQQHLIYSSWKGFNKHFFTLEKIYKQVIKFFATKYWQPEIAKKPSIIMDFRFQRDTCPKIRDLPVIQNYHSDLPANINWQLSS